MDATPHDPLIGQVIDGRYRVVARIAAGGMATVYRALDTRLDRTLALKVMHASLVTDSAFVERFIREAKSVARVDHINVVGVTDQSSDGDHVYLAMEYVAGGTLRDLLREGPLRPRAVLDLMEPVLAGLGAAHREGLVHRDVKPENVLIGDDGRVKVADFGLVRGVDTQSADTNTLLGTTSYLAPEQIEAGEVGPATDVYACGIMLYELLTGAKPHAGETAAQVLLAHVNRDVPPPSEVVPTVPAALDELVTRATARPVRQRPADALTLLDELRATRADLTDGELDAGPPGAGGGTTDEDGSGEDDTATVVTRAAAVGAGAVGAGAVGAGAVAGAAAPSGSASPSGATSGAESRDSSGAESQAGSAGSGTGSEDVTQVVSRDAAVPGPGTPEPTSVLAAPALAGDTPASGAAGAGSPDGGGSPGSPDGADGGGRADHAAATAHDGRARSRLGAAVRDVPRGVVALVGGVLVAVAAVVAWYVSAGQFVQTPGVYDLPEEEAVQTLEDAGLGVDVTETFSPNVEAGNVVSTDPERGERVRRNATVTVVVSQGPEVATVPDVVGEPLERAHDELSAAGLTPGDEVTEFHDDVPRGSVIATDPPAGEERRPNTSVELTVSRGVEVRVPDVVGVPLSDAEEALEDAGFEVRTESDRVHSPHEPGEVAAMSPDGGDSAGAGETVTLAVSKGPEMIVVPDVRGMEESDAREELEEAGFEVDVQRWFLTGTVFNQSVHSGDRAPEGSTITIFVR